MPECFIEPMTNRQECFNCHTTVSGEKKLFKCNGCHAITYCGKECQVADWPRHAWNCVPVMVTEIQGKGRGIVAAKKIKMGELIFKDKTAIKLPTLDSSCFELVMKQIGKLPSEAKSVFYKLEASKVPDIEAEIRSHNQKLGNEELLKFFNNCEGHDEDSWYLFLNVALINHSCAPNAAAGTVEPEENEKISEVRAIRNISKGEEICICYKKDLKHFVSTQERKMIIKKEFGFHCNCCVCSGKVPDQEDILRDYTRLKKTLATNHTQKEPSDWAREANILDQIVKLDHKLYIGSVLDKVVVLDLMAKTARMSRNRDLQKKAMDLWKKLVEDTKLTSVKFNYELVATALAKWSHVFDSESSPSVTEISIIFSPRLFG